MKGQDTRPCLVYTVIDERHEHLVTVVNMWERHEIRKLRQRAPI